MSRGSLLIISQVYTPDPAAVGQYMAESAESLAEQGYRVVVLTSDRGFDDPTQRFSSHEVVGGVEVRRLPWSHFGKSSITVRLLGAASFCLQALLRGLFLPHLRAVFVTTSPPMGSLVGWLLSLLRRVPMDFWVMDINPDQAVRLGLAKAGSFAVRLFDFFNRCVLRRARHVIALDRYMAETLRAKLPGQERAIEVLPPWPMEDHLKSVAHSENPFRRAQGWEDKLVVMYSGNHSLAHPLDTLLEATRHFRDDPRLVFAFIGGGLGKQQVEAFIAQEQPSNVVSLPYQPVDQIKYSLSAADVHVVAMGEAMVGLIHPCKVYGALSLARPVLYLGPKHSHAGEMLELAPMGWQVDHGDVDGMTQALEDVLMIGPEGRAAKGGAAEGLVESHFQKSRLVQQMISLLTGEG